MSFPLLLLLACSPSPKDSDAALPVVCHDASPWEPGTQVFRDASSSWGMKKLGATGVRINAVDFDGDGWIDLAIRAGNDPDDFPGALRSTWLLRNTGQGGFEDVTEASGVRKARGGDHGRRGPTWVWADVDNDGDLDVYTGVIYEPASEDTSEVMLNDGDGTFSLGPKGSDLRNPEDNPYGASFTDYDRDGTVDLFVANYTFGSAAAQDRLYRGTGEGRFRDRTEAMGLGTEPWSGLAQLNEGRAHSLAWSALACDLNDDGWPELLASSYGRAPNHLWRNDGGAGFTNASVASGYAFDHRTDWTDNESARCWCTLHPTDPDCDGVPAPAAIACAEDADAFRWNHANDREPYRLGGNSGQTVCRDVDNDGRVDLLTTEIVHWDVGSSSDPSELLFNTGEADIRFERPGNEATGLTRVHEIAGWNDGDITANTVDFDNDGWTDVYVGSSDYPSARGELWHQVAPRRFESVPIADGIDHLRSHGVAVADLDNDGDLDLIVGHSTARCDADCYDSPHVRIFENLSPPGNFVQLRLRGDGVGTNAAAIGAKVELTAGGLTQVQHVGGGGGQWGAQDPFVLHFGLGEACEAEVRVTWPSLDRPTETWTVQGGYRWTLTQGQRPVPDRR